MRAKTFALSPILVAAACLSLSTAASAVPCSTLPNPVYINGGGGVFIENLGRVLAAEGVTLIYKKQGSCLAVDSILNGTPLTGTEAAGNGGIYWDSSQEYMCDFDVNGNIADVGISDVFPSTCTSLPNGLPKDVGDYLGPVEAYGFAVPKQSTQEAISREAAYFVYGFGADSGVEPWTDPLSMFTRGTGSGTQQMLSVATGIPVDKWKGTQATSSSDIVAKLAGAPDKERAIGILASEVANDNPLTVKMLAYQDTGQSCAYYMDTSPLVHDKANVRDGHYPIWGPFHVLTKLDADGYPLDKVASDIVSYAIGTKDPMGLDLVQVLVTAGLIPECAMRVTRNAEMGPLASFQPPRSCACYFDLLTKGSTDCTPCASNVDCPASAPACNYQHCEVQ